MKHRCPDGGEGECSQIQGHIGQHLCKKCLSFFSPAEAAAPGMERGGHPPAEAAPQAFARMKQCLAAPRDQRAQPGQFQLAGIWNSQVETQYGVMRTELILDDAKNFSQQAFLDWMMTYDVGTYQVGEGYIHFNARDHEPKEYNGKKMAWITSWTYLYTVVDDNTMTFEDRITHGRWTVKRGTVG